MPIIIACVYAYTKGQTHVLHRAFTDCMKHMTDYTRTSKMFYILTYKKVDTLIANGKACSICSGRKVSTSTKHGNWSHVSKS